MMRYLRVSVEMESWSFLCYVFFFFLSFFFFFWALSVILGTSPGPAETISCPAKAAHFSLWNISHFTFPTFLLQETVWKHNGRCEWAAPDMKGERYEESYSMSGTGCWDSLWLAAEAQIFVTIFVYLHACMKERIGKRGGKWERQQGGTREKGAGEGERREKSFFLGFIIYTEIVLKNKTIRKCF